MNAGSLQVRLVALLAISLLAGCSSLQSAMTPTGAEAARVNVLLWVMTAGGAIIMIGVIVAAAAAIAGRDRARKWLASERFVLGAGLAFPVVVLTALLAWGTLTFGSRSSQSGPIYAEITGEQWWWRVHYLNEDGSSFDSANELRIPVGRPVQVELGTADVLHSFWVPNLAGKLDMIPGRTNVLTLEATAPGVSRGQCAEYCGGAHAFMSFHVVALEPDAFAAWQAEEAAGAREPDSADLTRGAEIFNEVGCGACHTVRGTSAAGTVGPDLTHVGGRLSIAAATLPNDADAFASWIRDNQHIKPENKMPAYEILSDEDLALLAGYLESLE